MLYHLSSTRPLLLIAAVIATFLACHSAFAQRPASPAELKRLVRDYAFRNQPKLHPETQFAIEEYAIDGLKALDVQIILARYLDSDGSQFNEALLIYHDGKLVPFANALGGHGLMSAVVSGGKLYYTYSFGSGRHFCRLAQLSIVGGKLAFAESGPLLYQDCFVKQDGARLRLEKGEFEKFNAWKAGRKIGDIAVKESGFAVLNDVGKEIETLAGKTIEGKGDKAGANKDLEILQGTWNIDTMEWGGKSLPKELMNGYKFAFAGNKLTWDGAVGIQSAKGKVMAIDGTFPCDFKIDSGKEPKQIDITLHLKKGDRTVLGIYEIKGDMLKVCYFGSNTGKRPAEFSTKDDRDIAYIVLTRAKK